METFAKIEKKALLEQLRNRAKSLGLSYKIINDCPLSVKCMCFRGINCSKRVDCYTIYMDKRIKQTPINELTTINNLKKEVKRG